MREWPVEYRWQAQRGWPLVVLALCMVLEVACATVQPHGGVLAQESWIERPLRQVGGPQPRAEGRGVASADQALSWEALQVRTPEQEEAARRAEVERALLQAVALTSGVERVGTTLVLRYWAEQGALTLVDYRARVGSGGRAGQVREVQKLLRELRLALSGYGSTPQGLLEVALRRQEHAWVLEVTRPEGARPPEARRLAVRQEGARYESYLQAHELAGRLVGVLEVPEGGESVQEVGLKLEDGWVLAAEVRKQAAERGGAGRRQVGPGLLGEITSLLLAFGEGLGPRTALLRIRAQHTPGEAQGRAWVEAVEVRRPPRPAGEDEDFAVAYRQVHEETLRLWREEVQEGTEWVVRAGVEELALWYVGGIAAKGAGILAELTLPVVKTVLGRGRAAAAGWLRSAMVRMRPESKLNFERLWAKLQLEGEAALSAKERELLRKVMSELDLLAQKPLDLAAKGRLRENARELYARLHPDLAHLLRQGWDYPVHHRRPLEYAHLFPEIDVNAPENLALVYVKVHERINALWEKFRRARPNATAEDVRLAAQKIDECFEQWYHKEAQGIGSQTFQEYLTYTESVALERLQRAFPGFQ